MRESTSASLKTAFTFPCEGEGWQNRFLVGAGLTLVGLFIPILPVIFVSGYVMEVMRRVIKGEAPSLPAWDDWGRLGLDGLRAGVAAVAYLAPGFIVYCGGMGLYFVGTMAIPVLMGFGQGDAGAEALGSLFMLGNVGVLMIALALAVVLFVLGGIPLPVAVARVAAEGKLGAAFDLRELWRILRANRLSFFIDWVIVAGLTYMMSIGLLVLYYSAVLCCLVPFLLAPAAFYVQLVGAARFAASYREGVEALAAETAPAA